MSHPDIDAVELTVEQVQTGLARGAFTAEALTAASLRQIAAFNPRYNAMIALNPEALDDAREIDRRRSAGEDPGPLAGVPVVVKDTMDMAGQPTTAGWSLLHGPSGGVDLIPGTDSPVVARLRAAGCVILGKTNVPILSHSGNHANDSWAGPTLNAAAPDRVPGGSSAGTATAVCAGMAVLGLAEETGGSIQNPASAQGLVGLKPTWGLVPTAGVMPLSSSRDVVGPIARCVRDAALCLDAIAGFTSEDPNTALGLGKQPAGGYTARLTADALRGKRLGLYGPGWRADPLSEETSQLYAAAQGALQAAGALLVADPFAGSSFAGLRRPLPFGFDPRGLESVPHDLHRYFERLGPSASLTSFADFARATARQDAFGPAGVMGYMPMVPGFAACLDDPSRPPDPSAFRAVRAAYLAAFDETMTRHGLDALVFPQMRRALPPLHGPRGIEETTVDEINIAGLPGLTVPAGSYASGAPFGLIFVGRLWSEADLFGFAFAYEAATEHRRVPALQA